MFSLVARVYARLCFSIRFANWFMDASDLPAVQLPCESAILTVFRLPFSEKFLH
jgi:hypothetical protein